MTNREKFIDEILAKIMLSALSNQSISDLGIKKSGDFLSLDDVVKWLNEECKEPEIEYMEVTNDIPRFTEIEVRQSEDGSWLTRYFLTRLRNGELRYLTTTVDLQNYAPYRFARIRKDWDKCKE